MSLRAKVVALLALSLVLACTATGLIFVARMDASGRRQIERVRSEALSQVTQRLKEEADIALRTIERFTPSIASVAAALEEMTSSITEIAR